MQFTCGVFAYDVNPRNTINPFDAV